MGSLANLCEDKLWGESLKDEHGKQEACWEALLKEPEAIKFLTEKMLNRAELAATMLERAERTVLLACGPGETACDAVIIHARMSELPKWFSVYLDLVYKHGDKLAMSKLQVGGEDADFRTYLDPCASGGLRINIEEPDDVPSYYEAALKDMNWEDFLKLHDAMDLEVSETLSGMDEEYEDSEDEEHENKRQKSDGIDSEEQKEARKWLKLAEMNSDLISEQVAENLEDTATNSLDLDSMNALARTVANRRRKEGPTLEPTPFITVTISWHNW